MDKDQDHNTPGQPGRKTAPVIIAVLAFTAIAIWLVPSDEKPDIADIPAPAGHSTTTGGEEATPAETPEPKAAAATAEGDSARKQIGLAEQGSLPLEQLLNQAKQLQGKGELTDAYLLYFYAARRGDAGACLTLGKQADPAYFSAGNSPLEQADVEQAHKWYLAAVAAGSTEAEQLLGELRRRVDAEAAEGDPRAQRFALQWR